MIQDHTIDQTLIELARTMKALKALRAARKAVQYSCFRYSCVMYRSKQAGHLTKCSECNSQLFSMSQPIREHSAAKRASLDLTRKLADLRQGR